MSTAAPARHPRAEPSHRLERTTMRLFKRKKPEIALCRAAAN
jgi:hypothetical protein